MVGNELTLFLGAGASLAAPARLPIFRWIRGDLAAGLGIELSDDRTEALEQLAPEVLMQLLSDESAPVEEILVRKFVSSSENATHWIAAEAALRGAHVWTTNGDDLIERSHAETLIRAAWGRTNPPADLIERAQLLKPHGSVASKVATPPIAQSALAFSSSQVIAPLSLRWARRLQADCADATVVIIGYAGADVDIREILDTALATAEQVTWFARREDEAQIAARYPRAFAKPSCRFWPTLILDGHDRPDIQFLEWADAHRLTEALPPRLRDMLYEPIAEVHIDFGQLATSHAAAARLLNLLNDQPAARRRWWKGVAHGRVRDRAHCLIERFNLAFWSNEMLGRPVQLVAASPIQPPGRWGRWARRSTTTRLINGSSPRAPRAAERAVHHDPSVRNHINLATTLRQQGRLSQALDIAIASRQEALAEGRADLHGQALWEQGYCLQLLGRLAESDKALGELADAFGPLVSGRWIAWGVFGLGSQRIYDGNGVEALRLLDAARGSFGAQGHVSGQRSCTLVSAIAHRMLGDTQRARELLDRIEPSAPRLTHEIIAFERGEAARFEGDLARAEVLYRRHADSTSLLHRAIGRIGLGEVQLAQRQRPEAAEEAASMAATAQMRFVELHALITLVRAGLMDEHDRRLLGTSYEIPSRPGITGIARYCYSARPEQHALYFP